VIGCNLESYVHEIRELSVYCYSWMLRRKEEGPSELRRPSVLCEVGIIESLCCNFLTKIV
jgi:hypothetical protein